jgi:hypothetical protein
MPHTKYNEGRVEKHKVEIRERLATLNTLSSNVDERDPRFAAAHPHTATTSVPESVRLWPGILRRSHTEY